jgi:hypothetical protein
MTSTFPINTGYYQYTTTGTSTLLTNSFFTGTGTYFNTNTTTYTYPYYTQYIPLTTYTIPNITFQTIQVPMISSKCDLCKKDISVPSTIDSRFFYLCPDCSKEMYQEMKLTAKSPDHPMLVAYGNEYSDAVDRLRTLRCPQCNLVH